jgi:hypothetical protein
MEMSAGPKPLPLITKREPWASGDKKPRLLAAFATLVMTGAAKSRGSTAENRKTKDDNRMTRRVIPHFINGAPVLSMALEMNPVLLILRTADVGQRRGTLRCSEICM